MVDRPILFSGPMIRALLDGRKTQTRRTLPIAADLQKKITRFVNVGTETATGRSVYEMRDSGGGHIRIPAGKHFEDAHFMPRIAVNDRLWVKETHAIVPRTAYRMSEGVQQTLRPNDAHDAAVYREGWERSQPGRWRPSIHMPRWASRLTLTVTDVRIERLQDCSDDDAEAEGITRYSDGWHWEANKEGFARYFGATPQQAYLGLWSIINGRDSLDANPWVVAYTFTVHRGNIDQGGRVAA
ncbi:MAG TPA: hypothetical protein VFY63_17165 [Pseudorhizobium sp.]|nr:hypothetical protein [Pseudorhizobium sp.]